MSTFGTELVHRVREFATALQACREEMSAASVERLKKMNIRNHYYITRTMEVYTKALNALTAFCAEHRVFGDKGFPSDVLAAMRRLISSEDRCDNAVCCITGSNIQTWDMGEGSPRYFCEDGNYTYHTQEVHEAIATAWNMVRPPPGPCCTACVATCLRHGYCCWPWGCCA